MARYSEIKNILKTHKLKITEGRIDILDYFLNQSRALSIKDLEKEFADADRVTLYRTLNSFTEQGVLHKIPDDNGQITYGVCHDTCGVHDHNHEHIHFKCNECGNIECLKQQHIPIVKIPGYQVTEANLILKGVCKRCAA